MSSLTHGNNISPVEVSNISSHGISLLTRGKALFMPYEDFPWFKKQTLQSITNVEELSLNHFYWPELDVDLTKEIIEYPERFPLQAKST